MQKTLALCVNWASGLCANHLGCDACTEAVSERSRNGLGTVSETGPLARPREGFARFELRGRRRTFARSSIDFVAGAALSQGQVSISWQAQHFRKVKYKIRGRRSTFARCCVHSLRAGGWQDALCVNWVPDCAQTTSAATPVRRRSRNGLGTVSERSRRRAHWHGRAKVSQGLNCVAGTALSQGQV